MRFQVIFPFENRGEDYARQREIAHLVYLELASKYHCDVWISRSDMWPLRPTSNLWQRAMLRLIQWLERLSHLDVIPLYAQTYTIQIEERRKEDPDE